MLGFYVVKKIEQASRKIDICLSLKKFQKQWQSW